MQVVCQNCCVSKSPSFYGAKTTPNPIRIASAKKHTQTDHNLYVIEKLKPLTSSHLHRARIVALRENAS